MLLAQLKIRKMSSFRDPIVQAFWSEPKAGDKIEYDGEISILSLDDTRLISKEHPVYWVPTVEQLDDIFKKLDCVVLPNRFGSDLFHVVVRLGEHNMEYVEGHFLDECYCKALIKVIKKYNGLDVTITKQFVELTKPALHRRINK